MIGRRELLSSAVAAGVPLAIAGIPTTGQARPYFHRDWQFVPQQSFCRWPFLTDAAAKRFKSRDVM
jgi:hypothetical protein